MPSAPNNRLTTVYHKLQRRTRMAKRQTTKPAKDHKVYTQTANKTKKINVKPKISRGGIRL